MKDFVNKILIELKSDSSINNNSLVKIVVESTDKSIINNENYDTIYKNLKHSLSDINEHVKSNKINSLINQFNKNDVTVNSILLEMSKVANLSSKLNAIKNTNAYTNPIIKSKVDNYDSLINSVQEFKLYPSFISDFTHHIHEPSIKKAIDQVINVVESRAMDLEVLNTISIMESVNSQTPIYESIVTELKKYLATNKYTSDIINLKFGHTNLPLINKLVNNLKVYESKLNGEFTLGTGSVDTKIHNLIAPAKKIKNGILAFVDNKFIKITESKILSGNETDVHINDGFIIATMNNEYIRTKHEDLYNLAEAFSTLGFRYSTFNEGIESNSVRNFKIGLNTNQSGGFDIYLNNNKVDNINLTEALVMETPSVRNRVEHIFNNLNNICTFEFIKNVSNDRLLTEATIFALGEKYIICDKINAADRIWNRVNETEMFNFFNDKFKYDISPIFGTQINETLEVTRKLDEAKSVILSNISKLEETVNKLNITIDSGDVHRDDVIKLEELKESIKSSINKLKEDYIKIDLDKKDTTESNKISDKTTKKSKAKKPTKKVSSTKKKDIAKVNETLDVSRLVAKYSAKI